MAFNNDTFWEDNTPSAGAESSEPALTVEEVQGLLNHCIVIPYVLFFLILCGALGRSPTTAIGFFVVPAIALYGLIAFIGPWTMGLRLFGMGDSGYSLERCFKTRYGLIRSVARSSHFMNLLSKDDQIGLKSTFLEIPGYSIRQSYRLGAMLLVLSAVLPLFEEISVELYSFQLGAVGFVIIALWAIERRATEGERHFAVDDKVSGYDSASDTFKAVNRAELRWDFLLGQEYLRLESGGKRVRYYNTTGDPLYLLRLAKQQLPHVELQL